MGQHLCHYPVFDMLYKPPAATQDKDGLVGYDPAPWLDPNYSDNRKSKIFTHIGDMDAPMLARAIRNTQTVPPTCASAQQLFHQCLPAKLYPAQCQPQYDALLQCHPSAAHENVWRGGKLPRL
eukprot:NODE_6973_length_481_cov_9.225989_g6807_i0.p1 GENE.NODE_6973_length_481_cov_9.225989_g6807_i0~~NODE_6973_length_481_cov_9.225989_g6807_i0.p1  ORF type:complete len:138 (+),score=8.67 NODE_6973_length_481_cov_9.225989_g6807_i0:46-414(+)